MNNVKILWYVWIFLHAAITAGQFFTEVVFLPRVVFHGSLTIFFLYLEARRSRWLILSENAEKSILTVFGSALLIYGIYHLFEPNHDILLGISITSMGMLLLFTDKNNLRTFNNFLL